MRLNKIKLSISSKQPKTSTIEDLIKEENTRLEQI
jgi:hypothetical protein